MIATTPDPVAVYAVLDERRSGAKRIVGEFVDPTCARTAADLLRGAGAAAEVVLLSAIPPEVSPP